MSSPISAYAHLEANRLILGNNALERHFELRDGLLYSTIFLNRQTNRQWISHPSALPSLGGANLGEMTQPPRLQVTRISKSVAQPYLNAEVTVGFTQGVVIYRFRLFDDLPAITMQRIVNGKTAISTHVDHATNAPSGIERNPTVTNSQKVDQDLVDTLTFDPLHCDLVAVDMFEQTDGRENLVFPRRWMLHPAESRIAAEGNVFYLEHRPTGEGIIFLKHAPAPYARPVKTNPDLILEQTLLRLRGHGLTETGGEGYAHTILCYTGGRDGRIAALQQFQLHLRCYEAGRDGQFLSNTWGDRNRDAAIGESFLLQEIAAGARLGVDVMQIDDGWQKGRSSNSAQAGGTWNGFWAADEQFWAPNPQRLPHGMQPILVALHQHGLSLGLWFAPDSSNHCANWQRDAQQVLAFWRNYGVRHVKIDAVKMHSKAAEANVQRFYQHVLQDSAGQICFDADVTAEIRPGFWGMMDVGPIFVENRYTDWHRYWPHHTLRNLWLLSHYIPPVRLRMEFLNVLRNQEKYPGDPLAPAC